MELSKGTCFFCSNTKVITKPRENVLSKIKSFLTNPTIDNEQLNEIKPLKVCPICYHKIHLLVTLNKNISAADKNGTYSCTLCGSLDEIIKVAKCDTFDKICSDFPVLTDNISPICSACLFFLDTRNLIKEKLISVYPNLKIDKTPKFDDNITSHSTPIPKKREKTSKSDLKSISKSRTSDVKKCSLDLSSIKIKPLSQQNEDLKLLQTVNRDHKFMNQILIVKLQRLNDSLENAPEFVKLENMIKTVANVRRSRNSIESNDSVIISGNVKRSRNSREGAESENYNENVRRSRNSRESKETKDNEIKIIEGKTKTKDKTKTRETRVKRSRIIEISSDSEKESKEEVKRTAFFKIKLNQKKKTAKQVVNKEPQPKPTLPDFKKNLMINLEQMNIPEKKIDEDCVEETNVVESEDDIELELKEDTLSPLNRIETDAEIASDDGDEKMDTSCDNKTHSTEENTQTTNEADTSVEQVHVKDKNIVADQNGLEEMDENVSSSREVVDDNSVKLNDVDKPEKTGHKNDERNSDSEATEKNESEETENKNHERNSDSEATEKNESEETGNKNHERNSDSEATEKNESEPEGAEIDRTDEFFTKDDIQIGDVEEHDGAPSKSGHENNVEEVTEQNGKGTKKGDDDLSEGDNNTTQEIDNDTQDDDNDTQDDDKVSQEDSNLSKVNSSEATDNLVSSIENNEQYISEIEAALEDFETVSELDKEDQRDSVVTLDSSQGEVGGEAGKRKRSESTDTNGPEKKKKKVTFSEDIASDD